MSAIQQIGNTWADVARKRFPYTAKHNIRGSGKFALAFKCSAARWRVNLYETSAERDAAWECYQSRSCGAFQCVLDHARVNL